MTKRGRPVKNPEIPKEIRDNINESNLPKDVLEAIVEAVSDKELAKETQAKARVEDSKKDPQYIGNCPVTGKPLFG
jgi:hypothetical protein